MPVCQSCGSSSVHATELCSSCYHKQYRARNRESQLAYRRKYRADHPDLYRAARARRRYPGGAELTQAERDASVAKRKALEGTPCSYCGTHEGPKHVDHAIPIARGGTDHADNLVQACAPCNQRKHTMTAEEFITLLTQN